MQILNVDTRTKRVLHITNIGTQLTVLLAGLLAPLMLLTGSASAAQLTSRSVTISNSTVSATTVDFTIAFTTPVTTNIGAIVVQNCTTALGTCTAPAGAVNNVDATAVWTGTSATNFSRQTTTTGGCTIGTNVWCGTRVAASETNGAKTIVIDSNTNQSTTATFYLRITTFTDAAFTLPTTSGQDTGVVAASTAANLTVTARIQESLTFCVGTTTVNDATTAPGACPLSGTSVDLGVLTSGTNNYSFPRTDSGTATNGITQLSTNAVNGSSVSYFSVQNSASGTLKVAGTACAVSTAYAGGSKTDICFNDTTTQTVFATTPANEGFGMTVAGTNCSATNAYACALASGTNNLKAVAGYIGATATTFGTGTGFAWNNAGTPTQIASSTSVVDAESLILKFNAWPVATTPTGSYTVTSVYIATSTY